MAKPPVQQPASVRLASPLTLGLLFFLPLIYLPDISYTALRYAVFGAVALVLGWTTAVAWTKAPVLPKSIFKSRLGFGMLGYLAAFLLASLFSLDRAASFWSSFQRTDGAFAMIFVAIFALNILTLVALKGKEFVYSMFRWSIAGAGALSVLIMMFTYHTQGTWFEVSRGGATVGNSSLAAAYVLWNVFFAAVLLAKPDSRKNKIIYGGLLAIMLLSPLFVNWQVKFSNGLTDIVGAARGATLGIIVGAGVAFGLWLNWQTGAKKKMAGKILLALILAATVVAAVFVLKPNSSLHRAFDSVVGENRFIFWNIGIKAFKVHPFLGWGPYTFNIPYQLYYEPKMIALPYPELWVDHAHNLFVETLATGGLVLLAGLLAFLASIVSAALKARSGGRLADWETAVILGALAGWLLQAQFVFESLASLAMLFAIAGIVYALAIGPEPAKSFARILSANKKLLLAGTGLALFALFVCAVALPYRKDRLMYRAYTSKLPARAALWQNFSRVSPMGTGFDSFIILNNIESAYEKNIDQLVKEQPNAKKIITQELDAIASYLYDESEKHEYGFEQSLLGAKFYYLRMSANNDFSGEPFERAGRLTDKALRLSPTDPEAYWIAAKIRFAAKDYAEAKDLLERAFALAPASKQTSQLILALAKATNDQAYYDSALARARQYIPGF